MTHPSTEHSARGFVRPSLSAILTGLHRTLGRFPLPLASALGFAVVMITSKHRQYGIDDSIFMDRLRILFFLGFFWLLASKLFAESRAWAMGRGLLLSAVGFALLALQTFPGPEGAWPYGPIILFFGPGLVLLPVVAPFLTAKGEDAAIWEFNRAAWTSAAFGILVAMTLALGLVAAYKTADVLLGVPIPADIYFDTFVLCLSVLWPLQALSGVPRGFASPEGDTCPRWLSFLIGYLLVPLVVVYLAILYLYLAKILIQWDLPKGQVGFLVSSYATFGVATHLLAYPLRDQGGALIRLFHRGFYPALFVPIALLAVAVGVRIGDYGVTEPRYALCLFALWLTGIALYFTIQARPHHMLAPLSLSLLLLAASFGPWGAVGVSTASQQGRLERLLVANDILVEGRIVPAGWTGDRTQIVRVSSVVNYFSKRKRLDHLRDWLAERGLQLEQDIYRDDIMVAMGLEYLRESADAGEFRYSTLQTRVVDVSGYEVLDWMRFPVLLSREIVAADSGRTYVVTFEEQSSTFAVNDPSGGRVELNLAALIERLRLRHGHYGRDIAEPMILEASSGTLRVRLLVGHLNGKIENGIPKVTGASATVLIGRVGAL